MAKKRNFKPGDMVQVIADAESEKYKKDDVGLVLPGTMYWPLIKSHANGRRNNHQQHQAQPHINTDTERSVADRTKHINKPHKLTAPSSHTS